MKRIYKYKIPLCGDFDLELPKGARILTVQAREDKPYIWAEVGEEDPKERRRFRITWTGEPIPEPGCPRVYIGTFQIESGSIVSHLFELMS